MIRAVIFLLILASLITSCQGSSVEKGSGATGAPALSEREAAILTEDAVKEIIGEQLVQANWLTLKRGNLVFAVNYATEVDPNSQPQAFFNQFNHVALIASNYFHQTNTQAVNVMVMAEDVDFPTADRNPPLRQIVIEKAAIESWAIDKITDAEFIKSWFVVPLEVFPTPG